MPQTVAGTKGARERARGNDTGNKRTPAPPTRHDTLSATLPLGDTRHKAQNTCGCRVANKQMRADDNTHSPIGAGWDECVEGRQGTGCLNQYVYMTLGEKKNIAYSGYK